MRTCLQKATALRFQSETEMAIKLEMVGFLETRPGWKGKRHAHAFWELVFMEAGRGTLTYRQETQRIHAGSVFLFRPHVPHHFKMEDASGSRHLYIGFSMGGGFPPLPEMIEPPLLDKTNRLEIVGELHEIASHIESRKEKAQFDKHVGDLLGVLLKLVSSLLSGTEPAQDADASRSAILAEKAKAHLADNLDRQVSVRDLAASFYLSPHYFGALFKAHTGMTIKAYHNFVRMQTAADLLRLPDLQASAVSDRLGFASIHYFSRKFRQNYGMSPTEYRRHHAEGKPSGETRLFLQQNRRSG